MNIRYAGLFSGIGGFSIAAEWMGWEVVFECEKAEFPRKVLKYHFPKATIYEDVTTTDFTIYRGAIDVLSAGFPCQPFSTAGQRKGSDDPRYLWPHTLRALKEIAPPYAIFENVFGLTSILESACETDVELEAVKLFSEGDNSEEVDERISEVKQRTLSIIIDQIYEAGYCLPEMEDGTPIICVIPACAVNAPHRRDRVWFIAHACSERRGGRDKQSKSDYSQERDGRIRGAGEISSTSENPNSNGCGGELGEKKSNLGQQRNTGSGDNVRLWSNDGKTGTATTSVSGGQSGQGENIGPVNSEEDRKRETNRAFDGDEGGWIPTDWTKFPTQSPIRLRNDGISDRLLRFVVKEVKYEISKTSKENRIENLQKVWEEVSKEEVWEKIRRLYSLESKDLLFQTMQLYSTGSQHEVVLSPFSEEVSEEPLRTLQKHGEFRSSPQGQELEKQRFEQFGDSLSFLPHEVALAARSYTRSVRKFEARHRQESIKALGNAIVPQVAFVLFNHLEETIIKNYEKSND